MGNPALGKNCLIKIYFKKQFVKKYLATIGRPFLRETRFPQHYDCVLQNHLKDWQSLLTIFNIKEKVLKNMYQYVSYL